jgi:hypothetical protein
MINLIFLFSSNHSAPISCIRQYIYIVYFEFLQQHLAQKNTPVYKDQDWLTFPYTALSIKSPQDFVSVNIILFNLLKKGRILLFAWQLKIVLKLTPTNSNAEATLSNMYFFFGGRHNYRWLNFRLLK